MCASTPNTAPDPVHVVAGILIDHRSRVLIARRPDHLHQGGLWEFPGGKRRSHEAAAQALGRELAEELSIKVIESSHFLTVRHQYPDKAVLLEFYLVERFAGQVMGNEGQVVRWVRMEDLAAYRFPEANWPVVEKLSRKSG